MWFGQSGKLILRYIGPYPIMECVRGVAYWLKLPDELSKVSNVFHVFQLCRYIPNPTYVIDMKPLQLREDLTYEKQPIEILDRQEKQLRNKVVPLRKVLWANYIKTEATWEPKRRNSIKTPLSIHGTRHE